MKELGIDREQLLKIADCVPAIVALYNIQTGEYLFINQAIGRILGYHPEEVIAGGFEFMSGLVHPDDFQDLMRQNELALHESNASRSDLVRSFEYRMRHKDGGWCWVHTEGTVFERDQHGKVRLILNVSLDVTDRKKAEAQLLRSMKALEEALRH